MKKPPTPRRRSAVSAPSPNPPKESAPRATKTPNSVYVVAFPARQPDPGPWWPEHRGHALVSRCPALAELVLFRCSCGAQLALPLRLWQRDPRPFEQVPKTFVLPRDNRVELPCFEEALRSAGYAAAAAMYGRLAFDVVPVQLRPIMTDTLFEGAVAQPSRLVAVRATCTADVGGCVPVVPDRFQEAFAHGVGHLFQDELGGHCFLGRAVAHLLPPGSRDIRDLPRFLLVAHFFAEPDGPRGYDGDVGGLSPRPLDVAAEWAGPFAVR